MKKIIILLVLFASSIINAQGFATFFTKTDAFLKKNVSNGKVDYQSIKNDPSSLNDILDIASKLDISKESTNASKAFWINVYNLSLIKGIVTKYPVKAPTDIAGLFDKTTYTIAGKKYTLNDIENKMIREKYNDARIHFVLVCGAIGCPPIINAAYLPETLEEQLNKQTKLAVNNPNFIKVNSGSKKVALSQIFEWYKSDFISKGKNEIDFINQYREDKIDPTFKTSYYPYDWTLNKK
jgi:Protein of unknown function, DUF547